MTAIEAAAYLGLPRSSFYVLVKRGRIHPINQKHPLQSRVRRLLFARADVERLAREG